MSNHDASSGAAIYDTMPMGDGEPWDRQSEGFREKEESKKQKGNISLPGRFAVWFVPIILLFVFLINSLPLPDKTEVPVFSKIDFVKVQDIVNKYSRLAYLMPRDNLKKIPVKKWTEYPDSVLKKILSPSWYGKIPKDVRLFLYLFLLFDVVVVGLMAFRRCILWRGVSENKHTYKVLLVEIIISGIIMVITKIICFSVLYMEKKNFGMIFTAYINSALLFSVLCYITTPQHNSLFNFFKKLSLLRLYYFVERLKIPVLYKFIKSIGFAIGMSLSILSAVYLYQAGMDILSPAGTILESHEIEDPPSNIENLCAIFEEKPHWYQHAKASANRHHTKIPVSMAIMYGESKFIANKRNPSRPENTAYGYPQATVPTWEAYQKNQKKPNAKRDKFYDSVDFIAWLTRDNMNRNNRKFNVSDTYHAYLLYHEGDSRYRKGKWRTDEKLKKTAAAVQKQAESYAQQLKECKGSAWYNG